MEEGGGGAVAGAHDQRVQTQLGRRALAARSRRREQHLQTMKKGRKCRRTSACDAACQQTAQQRRTPRRAPQNDSPMRKLISLHVTRHASTQPSWAKSRIRVRITAPHAPGARSSSPRSCAGPRPGPRRPPWAHRRSAPAARRRLPARRRGPSLGPRAAAGGPWRRAAAQASVRVSTGLRSR